MLLPLRSWSKLWGNLAQTRKSRRRRTASSRRTLCFEKLGARDMLAVFEFNSIDMNIEENFDGGVLEVYVYAMDRAPDEGRISVGYATEPGTVNPATAGTDYESANGRLTFEPGEDVKTINVRITDDMIDELDETFRLVLSDPQAENPGDEVSIGEGWDVSTITILDDDEPGDPTNPQPEIEVMESGMSVDDETGDVDFGTTTVDSPIYRTFTVTNTLIPSPDYPPGTGMLTLSGPTVPAGFTVDLPLGSTSLAPGEQTTFRVKLNATATGSYGGELSLGNNDDPDDGDEENPQYNFNIRGVVNPSQPAVTVSINDVTVEEGHDAVFAVAVSRALVSGEQVTVQFATQDDTAQSTDDCYDYTSSSGTLTFLPGQPQSQQITVRTREEILPEDDENFFVNLTNPVGATISDSQGVGTISNDDGSHENGTQLLVTAPDAGSNVKVHLYDASDHHGGPQFEITAYDNFNGGVRVATGDISGDGFPDVISGAGSTGGPHVRTFNGLNGAALSRDFFAYAAHDTWGIFVASGDFTGDGIDDIVTAPGQGGGPHVKIFDGAGSGNTAIMEWMAYTNFSGGVHVAAGDVNGDGVPEVITAAGPGGGAHVRVWNVAGGAPTELYGFMAYDTTFTGGAYVAAGDLTGDGRADIVTGAGAGGGPHVIVFNGINGAAVSQFMAYDPTFGGGVRPAVGDTMGNGENTIITGPGPTGGAHVRIFDKRAAVLCAFWPYPGADGVFPAGAPFKPRFDLSVDDDTSLGGAFDGVANYLPGYLGTTPKVSTGLTFASPNYVGQRMKLVVEGVGLLRGHTNIRFRIVEVTRHPGFAENASDPKVEGAGQDDYSFAELSDLREANGTMDLDRAWITIWGKDYGGYAVVVADITPANGNVFSLYPLRIPLSRENDQISDKWEADMVTQWNAQYAAQEQVGNSFFSDSDDKELHDPDNPTAGYVDQETAGDHISAFAEYRGFVFDGGGFDAGGQNGHAGGHKRLSAARKEGLIEIDHTPNLQHLPAGGVKEYFNSAARIWSREAGVHIYYVIDNSNLPAPPFDASHTLAQFDENAQVYLEAHRGQPSGNAVRDQSLRHYFTHAIVLSSIPGPKSAAMGLAYTERQTINVRRRGIYINTAAIQVQTNLYNQANPPNITTAEAGGYAVAHEYGHMVIDATDPVYWSADEHRIGILDGEEPVLMKSGSGITKQHLRESAVRIELVTQFQIDLANNPALE